MSPATSNRVVTSSKGEFKPIDICDGGRKYRAAYVFREREYSQAEEAELQRIAKAEPWNTEPKWKYYFDVSLTAQNFNSPALNFTAQYSEDILRKNNMSLDDVLQHLRREIIIFLEGSADSWLVCDVPYLYTASFH